MVLSPRTLRWSNKQLKWHCRSVFRAEEGEHISLPIEEIYSGLGEDSWKAICLSKDSIKNMQANWPTAKLSNSLYLWYKLVANFSKRMITFKADTLAAMSGIAREIQRHTGYEYHAGIWKEDIHNGLLWSIICREPNPSVFFGPSWSWAMLSNNSTAIMLYPAAFFLPRPGRSYLEPISDVLAIGEESSEADVFSQSKSSTLCLRAPYKNATSFENGKILLPDKEIMGARYSYVYPGKYPVQHGTICCWLDYCNSGEESSLSAATRLCDRSAVFLQIGRGHQILGSLETNDESAIARFNKSLEGQIWALILAPTGKAVHEYMRLGIARVSEVLAEGWEAEVVTIV
jgi:hypothetical protein